MDRTRVLDVVLREVSLAHPDAPLFAVEVGCMFSDEQGRSTSTIADSLAGRAAGGRLVTIDCDPDHILRARAMLDPHDAKAGVCVEFRQGFSTDILPRMLAANPTVHVAYLDGGGQPEICLTEFELVRRHLAPGGAILVDDAQAIDHRAWLPCPRLPLGKVNLILPLLILGNYQRYLRDLAARGEQTAFPRADFVVRAETLDLPSVSNEEFALLEGHDQHRMLVYGAPRVVAACEQEFGDAVATDRQNGP